MVGRSGEKKTFSIAARYADHLNSIAEFDELPDKLDALASGVTKPAATVPHWTSMLLTVLIDENVCAERLPAQRRQRMLAGSPAQVAEQAQTKVSTPVSTG